MTWIKRPSETVANYLLFPLPRLQSKGSLRPICRAIAAFGCFEWRRGSGYSPLHVALRSPPALSHYPFSTRLTELYPNALMLLERPEIATALVRNGRLSELTTIKPSKWPVPMEEFVVTTRLHDPPLLHHDDGVGISYRRQAVSDNEARASLAEP